MDFFVIYVISFFIALPFFVALAEAGHVKASDKASLLMILPIVNTFFAVFILHVVITETIFWVIYKLTKDK